MRCSRCYGRSYSGRHNLGSILEERLTFYTGTDQSHSIEDNEGFPSVGPVVGIVFVIGSESNNFFEALRTRVRCGVWTRRGLVL
jgi:hypothetical protein